MKRIFFALFLLAAYHGHAQQPHLILVTVLNSPDTNLRVTLPVNGTLLPTDYKTEALNRQHQFQFTNGLTHAGIVHLSNNFKGFNFFIEPMQSYTIILNRSDKEKPIAFTGINAEGNYLLNKLNHPDYQDKADTYMAKDSIYAHIKSMVDNDNANEQQQFANLYQHQKIDKVFYDFVKQEIDYYYAAVLSGVIYNNHKKSEFAQGWAELFKTYSLTNPAVFQTTSFYDYADQYANTYKTSYSRELAGTVKRFDVKKSNAYLIDWYHRYSDNLSGPTQEYMLARFLHRFLNAKKYEMELVDLFNDFKKRYPHSIYIPYLQTGVDVIITYHKKVDELPKVKNVIVLDNYSAINSLDELAGRFKNKTLFVDIWATWCGPCKEEFAYSADLSNYLKDKNAEILYISTDVDERDKDWHDMINYYNLAGTHIRASNKLLQDLIEKIWHLKKGYTIPRYVIIKNGEVVENNALNPSDKQKLYDQIAKYL
jgi:thiol-disulfide isomerase/thioredoxin